jgi:hypothetical protein
MGVIKTTPQLTQDGQESGLIALEITYGGVEAPFGGIDSSAAPPYIDPKCAVEMSGCIIIDNQIVAVNFNRLDGIVITPPAGAAFTNPRLAGFGNFYTQAGGYQNFVLLKGTDQTGIGANTMNMALYVWPSSNTATPTADVLELAQGVVTSPGSPATAIIETVAGVVGIPPSLPIASVSVVLTQGATVETYGPYVSTDSQATFAADLVSDITALPSALVTAVVGSDGVSVDLTSINVGAAQNQIQIAIKITPSGAVQFPGFSPYIAQSFQGGVDVSTYPSGVGPFPLSFASEGENLYLGGAGTAILQYVNETFSVLTQYLGANVLKKYAGFLLAVGITPSPGTTISSPEMVLAWSANGEFGIWNPLNSAGEVTGAGFEQLADIEDYLSGAFVMQSTIMLLRAKGISYATSLQNGTDPFDINHLDLAPEGEGCQDQLLHTQYGPVGFFVGNSNVYSFISNLQQIGDKIKKLLFPLLSPLVNNTPPKMAAKAISIYINGEETIFLAILVSNPTVGGYVFLYNVTNSTWTRITLPAFSTSNVDMYLEDFPVVNSTGRTWQKQSQLVLGQGFFGSQFYPFYSLQEFLKSSAPSLDLPFNFNVIFPEEEVAFGRDVTVSGVYIYLAGTPGVVIAINILSQGSVVTTANFTIPSGASYSILARYAITFPGGTIVTKNPQLQTIVSSAPSPSQLRIAKATIFASYDPNEQPVV